MTIDVIKYTQSDGTIQGVNIGPSSLMLSVDSVTGFGATLKSTGGALSVVNTSGASLGTSAGKTIPAVVGVLATTAATVDQVIATYTATAGKTFYVEQVDVGVRLTTYAATATDFGDASLEIVSGSKKWTQRLVGSGGADWKRIVLAEPIPVAAAAVVRVVCTPSGVTPFTWNANVVGYEK